MRGDAPTLKDIELRLEELILPQSLICDEELESLSPDDLPEEEALTPFKVDSTCHTCNTGVRIVVVASAGAIRALEQLLVTNLSIVCPECARTVVRHGRPY